ncbi:epimerase family protein SDR39U1 homolog, chloroplastic-like [Primulina tabacum]|uniref:epimerase family protein SDR39U1 homolog, chloroplastic-like n=1 Tax=Primulina tabacum TaxID=48773 RepID=UPI003F593817
MSFSGGSDSGVPRKANEMVVSITGATGFIGKRLVQRLLADNRGVHVLTRSRSSALSVFPVEEFPKVVIAEEPEWKDFIRNSTAVVNLAGQHITTRWTPEVKKEIKDSRIRTTTKVVDIINSSPDECRPKVLISSSACGYYGTSETLTFDEQSPPGTNYLAEVCREWEEAAQKVNTNVRLVVFRTGVVLGLEGGALASMIPAFKKYAGGPMGTGNQWFPWIHMDDQINMILEAMCNPAYTGAFNTSAPNPVRLSEFCTHLGSVLGRPSWLHIPSFFLRFALKEGAYVLLEGQNMVPKKVMELGYVFKYPNVKDALTEICLG